MEGNRKKINYIKYMWPDMSLSFVGMKNWLSGIIVNLLDAMLQSTIASSVPTVTQTDTPPSDQGDILPYYQADTVPTSLPPPGPITAISIPPAPQQPPHKDTKEGHSSPADNPGKERARDRCLRTAAVACECFCGCLLAAIIAVLGG
jgi:hypothetical protein